MTEKELKRLVERHLSERGYIYWFPPFPSNRFAIRDIFGVFDFVAIEQNSGRIIFVQMTTYSNSSKRIKKIIDFLGSNNIDSRAIQNMYVWAYHPKKNEIIYRRIQNAI